jgi:GxxExxY protein
MVVKEPIPASLNRVSGKVVNAAYRVHHELGPGLLESVYEACLAHELAEDGLKIDTQVILPVTYKNITVASGLKLDILVENEIILELKSVEALLPIHQAQLFTYLKLSKKRLGLLINFNVTNIRQGIKRLVL